MSYQPQSNNPYGQPGWNQQGGAPVYGNPGMAEAGMPKNELGFNDQTIRSAFVRKVFTIVSIMVSFRCFNLNSIKTFSAWRGHHNECYPTFLHWNNYGGGPTKSHLPNPRLHQDPHGPLHFGNGRLLRRLSCPALLWWRSSCASDQFDLHRNSDFGYWIHG